MLSINRSFMHLLAIAAACASACATLAAESAPLPLESIKLPAGFKIELYAAKVFNAREMALGTNGTLFVGSRDKGAGRVYAVVDTDKDGKADENFIIAKGLKQPSGVAFHDGALYVGDMGTIYRFDNIEKTYSTAPQPVVVTDKYPVEDTHGWKFIAFGPDGKLYVPIGAHCNACELKAEIYGTITRINPDGSGQEIVARGVRNTLGYDWNPVTKELWFTDNGRDMLGDDIPPDELNRIDKPGLNFGFPYWFGKNVQDPEFGKGHQSSEFAPPAQDLAPHAAALGMRFYTGTMFPEEYRNQIFIAEHGSFNRLSGKTGYRIACVKLDAQGNPTSYESFAEGWAQEPNAWGRPADVLVMPDGALLVADDTANCIYRISYKK